MGRVKSALEAGLRQHKAGNLPQAERHYRAALLADPQHPDALYLLGVLALDRGDAATAAELIGRAIGRNPKNPHYHVGLGDARRTQGDLRAAVASYRAAVSVDPNNAPAHFALGAAWQTQGNFAEAGAAYRRAIDLAPNFAEAHNNLGVVLIDLDRPSEAAEHFRRALALRPAYADARVNYGKMLMEAGRLAEAKDQYEQAIANAPAMAEAHGNLGNVLRRLAQPALAVRSYERALAAQPAMASARYNLAVVRIEQGHLGHALADLRQVLQLTPDNAEAMDTIAEVLETLGRDDEARQWYRKAAASTIDPALPPMQRRERHFALGHSCDRLGDYDAAFAHFKAANDLWLERLRRSGGAYAAADWERIVDRIIATPLPARQPAAGTAAASRLPVFVLGMPRSGTTLVEQILASHSEVVGAGELPDISQMAERIAAGRPWIEAVAALSVDAGEGLAAEYLAMLRRIASQARRVVNKLPINFLYLGLIRTLLPAAAVIHVRRDPLDVCLSNFVGNFTEPKSFTNDLADVGHFYGQYERLMAHWESLYPGSLFHLQYEALVEDLEAVSRDMIRYCGLDWQKSCLEFHRTERHIATASRLQARRPLYASSIGRWRRYERHLEPLLRALRRPSAPNQAARRATRAE